MDRQLPLQMIIQWYFLSDKQEVKLGWAKIALSVVKVGKMGDLVQQSGKGVPDVSIAAFLLPLQAAEAWQQRNLLLDIK